MDTYSIEQHDIAEALGFSSIDQMLDHQEWLAKRQAANLFTPRHYPSLEALLSDSYFCQTSNIVDESGAVFGYLHGKPYYCELVAQFKDGKTNVFTMVPIVPEITKQVRREQIAAEIAQHKSNINSWRLASSVSGDDFSKAIKWASDCVMFLSSITI